MFTDPVKNLRTLGLTEAMIVADLGAGTGFYSLAAAPIVPKGKVYAVEIQREYLMAIKSKARDRRLGNIEYLWGDIERRGGTKLRDEIVDAVIASNVLFQVENKDRFIDEARRILRAGGRLLVVDWHHDSPLHPHKKATISKDKAREMFESKGFAFEREIDAGEHQYGMIFVR